MMSGQSRRAFLLRSAGLASLALGVAPGRRASARAQAASDDPESTAAEMVTSAAQQAIDRGLEFLVDQQQDDGSFGSRAFGGGNRNVAIVGLAGLAFMAGGSTPGRGPHGLQINRCLNLILASAQESGFITVPSSATRGPMYGHGFATLFLAEVYGMTPRMEVRDKLAQAVKLIVDTQNAEGGWRYLPQRGEADISVTICQVMALRAARNAGLFVPNETIERCVDYVKRSQNADGGFMYMLTGGGSAFPRSAAGVVALYSAGVYDGLEISKGLEYLMARPPTAGDASLDDHFYYGQYYAVQAMWHAGGKYWRRWYPAIRDVLLGQQLANGSWLDRIGPEYATAMACLILQMPNNYLPIFQR